jgi:hypothetical protein
VGYPFTTTYWSYQNNSQYDTNRNAIVMHKTLQVTPHLQLLITDAFPLGFIIPQGAPYTGSFDGAGALLGDLPQRISAKFRAN